MNHSRCAAALAACLLTVAARAEAASVTLDFEGVAPANWYTIELPPGVLFTEAGYTVRAAGAFGAIVGTDFSTGAYGETDTLYYGIGRGAEIRRDDDAAFDLASFTGTGFSNASFALTYELSDGSVGTLTYQAADTVQTYAPALTNVVKLTLLGVTGFGGLDDFVVSSAPVEAVPLPAAAFLFAPAAFGLMRVRRRA